MHYYPMTLHKISLVLSLLMIGMLYSLSVAAQEKPSYTKQVSKGHINQFALQCVAPETNMKPVIPEKLEIQTTQVNTAKNDPYTRSANVTIIIDDKPKSLDNDPKP
ncbi:hypothetical protein SAMN05660772_02376 [Pasteurella testudinis DSM 23072]|uniref:Uncharacterized protein n=1 Tax=Pasteurella testudinis DSM 23072 TaxID=1122938 RepID=A0A1W1UV72_9PAST|nr:hypothetical protein [Pasteurella testudinis]SMB84879.1 hypothetical protein SAMN05660772_02376 [Pasteurella testudinis DSM 23072]SUB51238.1 Uncharacterised protein [Pasteurella testudinis]